MPRVSPSSRRVRARAPDDSALVEALQDGDEQLFAKLEEPLKLRLTNSRTFSSGAVLLEYVRRDADGGER